MLPPAARHAGGAPASPAQGSTAPQYWQEQRAAAAMAGQHGQHPDAAPGHLAAAAHMATGAAHQHQAAQHASAAPGAYLLAPQLVCQAGGPAAQAQQRLGGFERNVVLHDDVSSLWFRGA